MNIKHILVPVDFSFCSKNALRVAISIARKEEAKIHMVNAVHIHTPHPDLTGGSLIEGVIADYEAQVKQSYQELESELIELKDVPYESDRFLTYLTDAILSELQEKSIDLLIMGTREEHDSAEKLLGTHATDVIRAADVPVLVIPENVTNFNPKKIGFAADLLKVKATRALEALKWLASFYQAEIMAFHVVEKISDLKKEEQDEIETINDQLEGVESSVRTIEFDDIVEGIKHFTEAHDLYLLTLLPRRHNIFERIFKRSITKSVALETHIPLLTFQDT
jgi:nucleotide-binding universal stress UspA family protein